MRTERKIVSMDMFNLFTVRFLLYNIFYEILGNLSQSKKSNVQLYIVNDSD